MADVVISEHVAKAISLVLDIQVLGVVFASAIFGLFVGAIPGLTATMAAALLVPMTFFMPPLPALGAVVAVSAMAIFAGDLPAAMLRMPGTPASAAYAEESYAMALQGKLELNLSTNLVCSVAGGLVGVGFLMLAAPWLAEVAIHFSSFEYFWLSCLGLSCASLISGKQTSHALLSLLFGLGFACVGIDPVTGVARFTGESIELAAGIHLIPSMIGAFALSELMRSSAEQGLSLAPVQEKVGALFSNIRFVARTYWQNFCEVHCLVPPSVHYPGPEPMWRLGFHMPWLSDFQSSLSSLERATSKASSSQPRRIMLRLAVRGFRSRLWHTWRLCDCHCDRGVIHEGHEPRPKHL